MSNHFFYFALLLFIFFCYSNAQTCSKNVIKIDGLSFDIEKIKYEKIHVQEDNINFTFSICNRVNERCGHCGSYSACKQEYSIGLCLGVTSDEDKFELLEERKGFSVEYVYGQESTPCRGRYRTKIEVVCDESAQIPTNVKKVKSECLQDRSDLYTFRVYHRAGCPIGPLIKRQENQCRWEEQITLHKERDIVFHCNNLHNRNIDLNYVISSNQDDSFRVMVLDVEGYADYVENKSTQCINKGQCRLKENSLKSGYYKINSSENNDYYIVVSNENYVTPAKLKANLSIE